MLIKVHNFRRVYFSSLKPGQCYRRYESKDDEPVGEVRMKLQEPVYTKGGGGVMDAVDLTTGRAVSEYGNTVVVPYQGGINLIPDMGQEIK